MGCSPHPSWAVGTARGVAAPSGPQLEPLTPRYSPELLNIIKIQLLLLTATLQQWDKPPLPPRSAVRQELCSGPDPSLNTPWGNASPVPTAVGFSHLPVSLQLPPAPAGVSGCAPSAPLTSCHEDLTPSSKTGLSAATRGVRGVQAGRSPSGTAAPPAAPEAAAEPAAAPCSAPALLDQELQQVRPL